MRLPKLSPGTWIQRALSEKPILLALATAAGLAALLTLLTLIGNRHAAGAWLAGIDRAVFDVQQRLFAKAMPQNLLVVEIDAETPDGGARDLPRSAVAEFVSLAREAGASVIVLDLLGLERTGDPQADSAFAALLGGGGDIVLAADVRHEERDDRRSAGPLSRTEPRLPDPLFAEKAAGLGIVSGEADPDSVVRRSRVRDHVLGVPHWSLAVEVLRVHLGVPWTEVRLEGDRLFIGDHELPTGEEYYIDQRRLRPPLSIRNLTRSGALPTRARPLFDNAIVFVGRSGARAMVTRTPLYSSLPRPFVDASDLATLMDGPIRHDAPTILEVTLIWLLAIGGAAVFFLRSSRTAWLSWATGWLVLLLLYLLAFAGGVVLSAGGPALAWGLVFPAALVYRLHLSRADVMARNRSIEALARLREVQFDESQLAETLTPLLKTLGGALGANSVLLLQEGRDYWEVAGGIGAPPHDWRTLRRVVAESNGEPVLGPTETEAFVPIVVDPQDRRRILYVNGERRLGPLDIHTLLSVASGLHLGFHNRALTRSLEGAYLGILTTIGTAVEARDRGTEAHCQRLATYSCALALELSYANGFLDDLWVGATLHDIGKVGIPDSIFLKPGKLTAEEYQIMKQHTVLGYQILEHAPISEVAKMCVLHHHERWDGRGYPYGLKGQEIPRGARMVAVVDVFDALTADRVYRPAKPEEEALEILEEEAGGGLEPDLVDCFQDLYERGIVRGASQPIPEAARRRWSPRHERMNTRSPAAEIIRS